MALPHGSLIGSIDQGTSSTRFSIYDTSNGDIIANDFIKSRNIYPNEGWVEQDANELLSNVYIIMDNVVNELNKMGISAKEIKGIGIANQRESTIVWDKETGEPLNNCILWLDNRTLELIESFLESIPGRNINFYKSKTGLPISSYFSAFKLLWLIKNVPRVKELMLKDRLLFGTIDTWLIWKLTGNHFTDVSNAARTFLFNINTLQWDDELCNLIGVPKSILPVVKSSADNFGTILYGPLKGVPITGVVGDQSASLIGHNCFKTGDIKATYGTGCFIIQNLGSETLNEIVKTLSQDTFKSLIITVGYKLGDNKVHYALEASNASCGAAINWLQNNLGFCDDIQQIDRIASQVSSSHGLYFVPAFQGLLAPYWDPSASGLMIGLSSYTNKSHIVRAAFDSIAFQTSRLLAFMISSNSILKIDGGLVASELLCQTISDITGRKIYRPTIFETTSLGAALIAGHTLGFWDIEKKSKHIYEDYLDDLDGHIFNGYLDGHNRNDANTYNMSRNYNNSYSSNINIFKPQIAEKERKKRLERWDLAVLRSMKWNISRDKI